MLLVQSGEFMKTPSALPVRASISFPSGVYEALENIAKQKKVSLAWVVRDAVDRYIAAEAGRQKRPARWER
jgi:metal-responsive CopG/Arc/MetJ family transcriptional regulator